VTGYGERARQAIPHPYSYRRVLCSTFQASPPALHVLLATKREERADLTASVAADQGAYLTELFHRAKRMARSGQPARSPQAGALRVLCLATILGIASGMRQTFLLAAPGSVACDVAGGGFTARFSRFCTRVQACLGN